MIDVLESVFSILGESFKQKNFLVVLFLIISFSYIEERTDFLFVTALNYKISTMKELSLLSKDENVQNNPDLYVAYSRYIREFAKKEALAMNFTESFQMLILKFSTGSFLGFGYIIWALRSLRQKKDQLKVLRGAFAVAVFFGLLGVALPLIAKVSTWISLLVNLIGLSVFQIFLLMYIGSGKKRKKDNKRKSSDETPKPMDQKNRRITIGKRNLSNAR